jgi:hypothetical protein
MGRRNAEAMFSSCCIFQMLSSLRLSGSNQVSIHKIFSY